MRIAIAACATNPKLSASNETFRKALEAKGVDVVPLNWNEHSPSEFLSCDLTCLRQTWDYQDDPGGFAAWLIRLHARGARIEARPDLAIWNNDKRTLVELERAGFDIPLTLPSVDQILSGKVNDPKLEEIVLKPAFGGDGVGVQVTRFVDLAETYETVQRSVPGRPILAQEFLPEISYGEWKMTCIDGKVELAVHAKPRGGEFRINSRFGPTIDVSEPPEAARSAAEDIMAFVGKPLCARVDGVMRDNRFICTELELCDPDLHLHYAPDIADVLAEATLRRVDAVSR